MSREWVSWAQRWGGPEQWPDSPAGFRLVVEAERVLLVIAKAADNAGYADLSNTAITHLLETDSDPLFIDQARVLRLTQELAIWGVLERVRSRKRRGRGWGIVGYQLLGGPQRQESVQVVAHAG